MDVEPQIEVDDFEDDSFVSSEEETTEVQQDKYRLRMRHFFYIHLFVFIIMGLLAGLIIYLIENYSAVKNQQIDVSYINAWFVSCTCIYSCGLTTLDFAKLSKASQIILLVITVPSGVTLCTLPFLIVKAYTHKHIDGITVDNDHADEHQNSDNNPPSSISSTVEQFVSAEAERKIALLPPPRQIRYWAYIIIIFVILLTCISTYLCYFLIIGAWLDTRYSANQLAEGNITISPWYASVIIVITGFNQNGLTPFSNGMHRFVNDVYMNIFVMMVVISGTSLFPFLLRNIILACRHLVPWRYKIIFDYILLNHHQLSTLLYPKLQTRIYLCVTFLLHLFAISVSLIPDMNSSYLAQFSSGTRLLIFVFHSINARFAGFQTIDINQFTSATLIIYLLLMITKPHMLCALTKSRFELTWISLQKNQKRKERLQTTRPVSNPISAIPVLRRRTSSRITDETFLQHHVDLYIRRQCLATRKRVNEIENVEDENQKRRHVSHLYFRLFVLKFIQAIFKHTMYTLSRTRTWIFIFVFLISAIEHERITNDPNVTVFKIVFEVISAFGGVGLTLGYPNVSSSFATVLSATSRVILGITMLIGRHRGLLASMKDQEEVEHTANDLIKRWKEKLIRQYDTSTRRQRR